MRPFQGESKTQGLSPDMTITERLAHWAHVKPNDLAYAYWNEGRETHWSFSELHQRACSVAGELLQKGMQGERALQGFRQDYPLLCGVII